jgi:predicted nucleotidyltransferase
MDMHKLAEDNLFFLTVSGSRAYGTHNEQSDTDYRGIFFGNERNIITPFFPVEQVEGFRGHKDAVVYEFTKFMEMLVNQNPNVVEFLWVDNSYIQHTSPAYEMLRGMKDRFLSSKCKFTFSGYANSQLKRIKGHNKWINNEQPKRRPKEVDFVSVVWNQTPIKQYNKTVPFKGFQAWHLGNDLFGLQSLDDADVVWHDIHEALVSRPVVELVEDRNQPFDLIVKFNRESYKHAVENWKNYWDWKKNRNEARSELEAKFGYDTKHAMHLTRLLRMGLEILQGKGVIVHRPDAEELKAIRNGAFTYEQIVEQAGELDKQIEEAYLTTKLPHSVDVSIAADVVEDIYNMCWPR